VSVWDGVGRGGSCYVLERMGKKSVWFGLVWFGLIMTSCLWNLLLFEYGCFFFTRERELGMDKAHRLDGLTMDPMMTMGPDNAEVGIRNWKNLLIQERSDNQG